MAFEIKPFPEFSWSYSRHKTFASCKRSYYYTYYAGHNGWLRGSSEAQKHAYRLKKMQTLPLAVGQIVHDILAKTIQDMYQNNRHTTAEALQQRARQLLNDMYKSSIQPGAWFERPSKNPIFQEMYYFKQLDKTLLSYYNGLLLPYFENFFASQTMQTITQQAVTFKQLEDFSYMKIDGTKVYVVLDLLYVDESNNWHITDWKTGKPSTDDREQLMLYAYYVHEHYKVPYANIQLHLEYLTTRSCETFTVNEKMLANIFYLFEQSTLHMKGLMADMIENEPLAEEDFDPQPTSGKCMRCNYLEICDGQDYFPSNFG